VVQTAWDLPVPPFREGETDYDAACNPLLEHQTIGGVKVHAMRRSCQMLVSTLACSYAGTHIGALPRERDTEIMPTGPHAPPCLLPEGRGELLPALEGSAVATAAA
jgi:hypothetical protein